MVKKTKKTKWLKQGKKYCGWESNPGPPACNVTSQFTAPRQQMLNRTFKKLFLKLLPVKFCRKTQSYKCLVTYSYRHCHT